MVGVQTWDMDDYGGTSSVLCIDTKTCNFQKFEFYRYDGTRLEPFRGVESDPGVVF
jgi:hypothetical protein